MQRVGKGGIEFGAKADQAGSVGRGEFEHTSKPRRRLEQIASVMRLAGGSAAAVRELVCAPIAERLQYQPDVGISDVSSVIAEQPRSCVRKQI